MSETYLNDEGVSEVWEATKKYIDKHSGLYGFEVNEEGHLILGYTGDEPPAFSLENGHLYYDVPPRIDLGQVSNGGFSENIYSEDEVRIGTWIDGKPLYRKIVTGLFEKINTTKVIGYIANIDTSVLATGFVMDLSNYYCTIPDSISTIVVRHQTGDVVIWTNSSIYANRPATVIVEYTKTTDSPQSATSQDFPMIKIPSVDFAPTSSAPSIDYADFSSTSNEEVI